VNIYKREIYIKGNCILTRINVNTSSFVIASTSVSVPDAEENNAFTN